MPLCHSMPALKSLLLLSGMLIFSTSGTASESGQSANFETEKRTITVTQVVSGLNHPWSIAFISDTDWLITERNGSLRRVVNGELLKQPVTGLPEIASTGQGGLLDVVLHPDFSNNKLVYLSYSAAEKGLYGTEVLKATLTDQGLQNANIIFKAEPKSKGGRHFGSRLAFDNSGYLYVSLGDRGNKEQSQQLNTHPGAVIRLHDDGRIPQTNPFLHHKNALPGIYSYGHRNIQGMAYDAKTNTLWAHEHGPQGGDELNRVLAGQNYGWPVITYGVNYGVGTKIGEGVEKVGMQQPVTYWDPSIAPSGLALVTSPKFPQWSGNLLVGALKFQLLARLELKDGKVVREERLLSRELGRIRDIRQGPDGALYLLTDESDGKVFRID